MPFHWHLSIHRVGMKRISYSLIWQRRSFVRIAECRCRHKLEQNTVCKIYQTKTHYQAYIDARQAKVVTRKHKLNSKQNRNNPKDSTKQNNSSKYRAHSTDTMRTEHIKYSGQTAREGANRWNKSGNIWQQESKLDTNTRHRRLQNKTGSTACNNTRGRM